MSKALWLIGQSFDRLSVIEFSRVGISPNNRRSRYWVCQCICGTKIEVLGSHLTSGHTKSCGCIVKESSILNIKNRKTVRGPSSGLKLAFNVYRQRSKKRGRTFSISIAEFNVLTSQNCFYCDKVPAQTSKGKNGGLDYTYNGLDRKDNDSGYTSENVVACCIACNKIKGNNLTFEEFKFISQHLKEFRKAKI